MISSFNGFKRRLVTLAAWLSFFIGIKASWHLVDEDIRFGRSPVHDFQQNHPHKIEKWPFATVFYEIHDAFNSSSRRTIEQAMEEMSFRTCVKFVPRDPNHNEDYVFIQLNLDFSGCRTQVGLRGGRQFLTLDNHRCIQHGRILHELMHSIGFTHEHQRPDRDLYVRIVWDNIKEDEISQFKKLKTTFGYSMGFPYDYGSITHYANVSPTASIDKNQPIILPKKWTRIMGQREGLSRIDVMKINKLYNCPHN